MKNRPEAQHIGPTDLGMLQRVLDQAAPTGDPAKREDLATQLIALFQSGVVSEVDLVARLKAHKNAEI